MTSNNELSDEEAFEKLESLSRRDIDHIDSPAHYSLFIDFTDRDGTRYRFEFTMGKGNMWLHDMSGDGSETVWTNKSHLR